MRGTKKLYVDDLVITEASRSNGVGRSLLAGLVERARAAGCRAFDLDSAVHRTAAHRLYMRERLGITAFHFGRVLD